TLSLSLIIPNARIAKSLTPFPDAIGIYWGPGAAAIAAVAIGISAIGGLNVAMLGGGEMLFSMSLRSDMPRFFSRTNRLNASKETTQLFAFITVLASDAVLYLYAAAAIAAAMKDRKPLTYLATAIGL